MNRLSVIVLATLFSLALLSFYFIHRVYCYNNVADNSGVIYVKPGTTKEQLFLMLDSASVIKNLPSFKVASKICLKNKIIRAGRYQIEAGMNNKEMIRMFKLGLQKPHTLVLAGHIRELEKVASILSSKIYSDSASIMELLTNPKIVDSLGFNDTTILGMFILDSYEIYWTTSPINLINKLHNEYQKFWNSERRAKASQLGLTPKEVTALASIVAEESNISSEHPIIAGVYLNRLKRGMYLQADPTVKFALKDPSIKRILNKHLEVDSPYNTYKRGGIPPGPIVVPSAGVIDAVLNHSHHNYLYFCADPSLNGTHRFATTLTDHNRNAMAYRAVISRMNRNS